VYSRHEELWILTSTNSKTFPQPGLKKDWKYGVETEGTETDFTKKYHGICWGGIYVDEIHLCKSYESSTNPLMAHLRAMNT